MHACALPCALCSQVSGDGAHGCQPLPGYSDGAGPREAVLPALSDALWNQTPARRRHHTQGEARSCNTHKPLPVVSAISMVTTGVQDVTNAGPT